jgi:hypothetical protein
LLFYEQITLDLGRAFELEKQEWDQVDIDRCAFYDSQLASYNSPFHVATRILERSEIPPSFDWLP